MDFDTMTTAEVDRLIDWFIKNGLTLEQARACIKHIAGRQTQEKTACTTSKSGLEFQRGSDSVKSLVPSTF